MPVFVEELPLTRVRGELHRTLRLAEGTHRLPVHLGDDQPILTVQVTIDLSPPTLDVLTPRSGDACHDAQFTLNVAVDDTSWPVTLFVDDAPHRVDHPGEFTLTLPAPDQERWLAIRARDRWGHETPLHEVLVRPASSLDLALSRLVDDSGGVRDPNDPVGREALRACQRALDQQPPTFGWKRRASDLNRLTVAALGQRLGEPWASDEAAEARALAWGDPRVVSVLPRHGGWLSTHEFVGALLPRQLDRVCRRWLADTRAGLRSEGTGLSVPGSLRDVAPSWSEAAWRAWLRHHAPASLHEAIETRPLVWRGG